MCGSDELSQIAIGAAHSELDNLFSINVMLSSVIRSSTTVNLIQALNTQRYLHNRPAQQTQLQTTTVDNVRPGQPVLYLWNQSLLKANRPNPYLPWTAKETPLVQWPMSYQIGTHLRSRSTRHTIRSLSPGGGATSPALGWNTPRQRARRSARPSFVPSASTTTVPRQPGSTTRRSLLGSIIMGAPPGGGRMVNEERLTHRTTV